MSCHLIVLIQESNLCLLHCRWILYCYVTRKIQINKFIKIEINKLLFYDEINTHRIHSNYLNQERRVSRRKWRHTDTEDCLRRVWLALNPQHSRGPISRGSRTRSTAAQRWLQQEKREEGAETDLSLNVVSSILCFRRPHKLSSIFWGKDGKERWQEGLRIWGNNDAIFIYLTNMYWMPTR